MSPNDENLQRKANQMEIQLNLKSIYEAKGAQIRSKVKWIKEGENNTHYFLTLEKIRGHQKIMTELMTEYGIKRKYINIHKSQVPTRHAYIVITETAVKEGGIAKKTRVVFVLCS